jgi:methionyl-tRNA formyltransferase
VRAGHEVVLVLTQPDRPAGRGMRLSPSAVATAASRLNLPVSRPTSLRSEAALHELRTLRPDVMVVAAYGLILPQPVLDVPLEGCLNIHASLLPRWRGAAPVHRAILAGDQVTGVTIMRMEAGLDTGPSLLETPVAIACTDTTGTLTEKLARVGAEAVVEALARLGSLVPRPQDSALATYASKVSKDEAMIDWSQPAANIERMVRAFNPSPGAEAMVHNLRLKIWEAQAVDRPGIAPGALSDTPGELVVGCGHGALRLLVVQKPGARRMVAGEFLRGNPWSEVSTGNVKGLINND